MKIRRQSLGPLSKGDQIEVKRPNGAYYAATVLRPPSAMQINMVFVEYHAEDGSKCVRGYVDLTHVRPSPPLELNRCFKIGDAVDAYWENGWHQGVVRDLLKDSKYVVGFHGNEGKVEEKSEIHQCNLRLHREWDDGSWVPSMAELANSSNENDDKPRNVKLKIVFRKKQADAEFRKGDEVEITSDEEGFRGSWYNAVIVEYRGNDTYLVEYSTSRKEDGVPLRAEAKAQHIRPCPPELSPVASFCLREVVDARYNDGWWIGVISRVLDGSKYAVYFSLPDEELEFDHLKLRIHQDWKNGKWIIASEENSRRLVMNSNRLLHKMDVNEKRFRVKFPKGTRVEVKSDEPGYEGSWYSAIIVDSLGNDKYLVEYLTLKTEDLGAFLREEAYASYIRPRPQHARCTRRYKLFENVDAWYNDGWWIGQVIKVLTTWKYAVYFQTTNEVMEFEHNDLRLHQEWINGKWIIPSKDTI